MQQWEYIWASMPPGSGVAAENGTQLLDSNRNPTSMQAHDYLNVKGADGWEVVSMCVLPHSDWVVILLKRPKDQSQH